MTIIKKALRITLKAIALILLFYVVFYAFLFISWPVVNSTENVEEYDEYVGEVKYAEEQMPSLSELGFYEEFSVKRKTRKYILWKVETVTVTVKFNEEHFEDEINKIESSYSFVTKEKKSLTDFTADCNGYNLRVVESDDSWYPKYFMIIGINEESKTIIYAFNYDQDVDGMKNLDRYFKKHYAID